MSTIDEIMGRISRYAVAVCKAKTNREMSMLDDARDSLRDLIAAELAAKDAEIERLKAQIAEPVPGEWVEWKGGECPIADGVRHQVKLRDGYLSSDDLEARSWVGWDHIDGESDIVAYRVLA